MRNGCEGPRPGTVVQPFGTSAERAEAGHATNNKVKTAVAAQQDAAAVFV